MSFSPSLFLLGLIFVATGVSLFDLHKEVIDLISSFRPIAVPLRLVVLFLDLLLLVEIHITVLDANDLVVKIVYSSPNVSFPVDLQEDQK